MHCSEVGCSDSETTDELGIILSHYKDDLLVEYATYGLNTNLFVSKYELYLPDTEQLRKIVGRIVDSEESEEQ